MCYRKKSSKYKQSVISYLLRCIHSECPFFMGAKESLHSCEDNPQCSVDKLAILGSMDLVVYIKKEELQTYFELGVNRVFVQPILGCVLRSHSTNGGITNPSWSESYPNSYLPSSA